MNDVPMNDAPRNDKDLQLNSLIQQMAQQHQPELPSPGVIWWRARIQKKFAEKERIERPLVIMRMLAGTVGLVVVAWLVSNYGVQSAGGCGIFRRTLWLVFPGFRSSRRLPAYQSARIQIVKLAGTQPSLFGFISLDLRSSAIWFSERD